MRRLNVNLLATLMLLAALEYYGCKEPEATGGPEMESVQDTFVWTDTSELEIKVVEIREDSVRIVELRSPKDTNRIYTEKRYTAEELKVQGKAVVARIVQDIQDVQELIILQELENQKLREQLQKTEKE